MAQKTIPQLNADIAVRFSDNTTGLITPAITRTELTDLVDSHLNKVDPTATSIVAVTDFTNGLKKGGINVLTGNRAYANGYIIDSALQTTFAALTTPYIVNFGTAFNSTTTSSFTISNAGRFRYTGTPTINANIMVSILAVMVGVGGSTARRYKFHIAKNGTPITAAVMKTQYTAGYYNNCVTLGSHISLATNDYLELYVSAIDATSTLNVDTVQILVEGF